MDATIVGLAPAIARTTFYVASAIILAGFVSGLVMLGLLQLYARERIQRVVLFHFLRNPEQENGFWRSGLVLLGLSGREASAKEASAKEAASLLGMPERALCRLYYRQISGQFLAAANAEAARSGQKGEAKPLLAALTRSSSAHPPTPGELEAASRAIDVLQVRLGDAVAKAAMAAMVVLGPSSSSSSACLLPWIPSSGYAKLATLVRGYFLPVILGGLRGGRSRRGTHPCALRFGVWARRSQLARSGLGDPVDGQPFRAVGRSDAFNAARRSQPQSPHVAAI